MEQKLTFLAYRCQEISCQDSSEPLSIAVSISTLQAFSTTVSTARSMPPNQSATVHLVSPICSHLQPPSPLSAITNSLSARNFTVDMQPDPASSLASSIMHPMDTMNMMLENSSPWRFTTLLITKQIYDQINANTADVALIPCRNKFAMR